MSRHVEEAIERVENPKVDQSGTQASIDFTEHIDTTPELVQTPKKDQEDRSLTRQVDGILKFYINSESQFKFFCFF